MPIVDQYGNVLSSTRKFAHAASRDTSRGPQYTQRDRSLAELIPSRDRKTLVMLSKILYQNMGAPIRAATIQKAEYSIGAAFLPTYSGADFEEAEEALSWIRNVWFPLCNVIGGSADWWTTLEGASEAMDRDGEDFTLLTTDSTGTFPRIQAIPNYMVTSGRDYGREPSDPIHSLGRGKEAYRGLRLIDGVVYNPQDAAVAYRVQIDPDNPEDADFISARSIVHTFDRTYQRQGRGLPVFTHALDSMKMMLQSTEYELIRQSIVSSISMVEKNETGGPDLEDPGNDIVADSATGTGVVTESIMPGFRYFRANSGSGLESIKHENPGPIWESFNDRMIRAALAPVWSYGLGWKGSGQGTDSRLDIERARRFVVKRQKQLKYLAKRCVTYAIGHAAENGRIPLPGNFLKLDFTVPPRLTVDDGREAKSLTESYRAGSVNQTEIQGYKGRTLEQHLTERAEEAAKEELARLAAEQKYGVKIDPRKIRMITPNDQAPDEQPEEPQQENDEDGE